MLWCSCLRRLDLVDVVVDAAMNVYYTLKKLVDVEAFLHEFWSAVGVILAFALLLIFLLRNVVVDAFWKKICTARSTCFCCCLLHTHVLCVHIKLPPISPVAEKEGKGWARAIRKKEDGRPVVVSSFPFRPDIFFSPPPNLRKMAFWDVSAGAAALKDSTSTSSPLLSPLWGSSRVRSNQNVW